MYLFSWVNKSIFQSIIHQTIHLEHVNIIWNTKKLVFIKTKCLGRCEAQLSENIPPYQQVAVICVCYSNHRTQTNRGHVCFILISVVLICILNFLSFTDQHFNLNQNQGWINQQFIKRTHRPLLRTNVQFKNQTCKVIRIDLTKLKYKLHLHWDVDLWSKRRTWTSRPAVKYEITPKSYWTAFQTEFPLMFLFMHHTWREMLQC